LKLNLSSRNSFSVTHRLARDINHLRTTIRTDVRETLHKLATNSDHFSTWLVVIAKVVLLRFSIHNIEEEFL